MSNTSSYNDDDNNTVCPCGCGYMRSRCGRRRGCGMGWIWWILILVFIVWACSMWMRPEKSHSRVMHEGVRSGEFSSRGRARLGEQSPNISSIFGSAIRSEFID